MADNPLRLEKAYRDGESTIYRLSHREGFWLGELAAREFASPESYFDCLTDGFVSVNCRDFFGNSMVKSHAEKKVARLRAVPRKASDIREEMAPRERLALESLKDPSRGRTVEGIESYRNWLNSIPIIHEQVVVSLLDKAKEQVDRELLFYTLPISPDGPVDLRNRNIEEKSGVIQAGIRGLGYEPVLVYKTMCGPVRLFAYQIR